MPPELKFFASPAAAAKGDESGVRGKSGGAGVRARWRRRGGAGAPEEWRGKSCSVLFRQRGNRFGVLDTKGAEWYWKAYVPCGCVYIDRLLTRDVWYKLVVAGIVLANDIWDRHVTYT